MRENIYDKVLEKTLKRVELASDRIARNFKGVKPFDKELMSSKEQIYNYSQISPQMEMALRQSIGDDVMDDYKFKIERLLRRYK